jgi:hypothetical protein
MLTHLGAEPMLFDMVPDAYAYRRASRLIEQHGDDARLVAMQLVAMAVGRRDQERALLMMRIRSAVEALQAPPKGPLH